MPRLFIVVSVGILVALLAPLSTAEAIEKIDPVDPGTGSPSGFVYSIPLDSAREDAAPTGGFNGEDGRAPVHSDEGFGSSTQVPGVTPAPTADASATPRPGNDARGGAGDGRGAPNGSGTEDDARGGAGSGLPEGPQTVRASTSESDSALGPLALLALALVVGTGLAAVSRRARG